MSISKIPQRIITMVILFSILLSLIVPASAVSSNKVADTQSATTFSNVKASYIDAENGEAVSASEIYATIKETTKPQEIDGYQWQKSSETVEYIYASKCLPYIIGYPDGSVRPDGTITRAEAVTALYRLFDGDYPKAVRQMNSNTFEDVPSDAWYWDELKTMYNVGIADGRDETSFQPNEDITRAELASLAVRWAKIHVSNKEAQYDDVEDSHWASNLIAAATDAGWIDGYPDGSFRPDSSITRAESMKLINGMVNRSVDSDTLTKLKVRNPYNDILSVHWAFTEVMEASVQHNFSDWHSEDLYNDGVYNVIVETFVDDNGKEIAELVTSDGQASRPEKTVPGYEYVGYVKHIVHNYTTGEVKASVEKNASTNETFVGGEYTYTIDVTNAKTATSPWYDVVVTDKLDSALDLDKGSVTVDGKTVSSTLKNGTLSIDLGDIAIGQTKTIAFDVKVTDDTAYGKSIENKAVATGTDKSDKEVSVNDTATSPNGKDSVYVGQGNIQPYIVKKSYTEDEEASVGDTVTYTIKVGNKDKATYKVVNPVVTDTLPSTLDFKEGSVKYKLDNGKWIVASGYSIDKNDFSAVLNEMIPNYDGIEPGHSVTIQFKAVINETAYGKTIQNTAVLAGDNINSSAATDDDDTPADLTPQDVDEDTDKGNDSGNGNNDIPGTIKDSDDPIVVGDGNTDPYIEKSSGIKGSTLTKDGEIVKVGDTITFTVEVGNNKSATKALKNGIITDTFAKGLSYKAESGRINGKVDNDAFDYNAKTRTLTVSVGDIEAGKKVEVTFDVAVGQKAMSTYINNEASFKGDNSPEVTDTDFDIAKEPEDQKYIKVEDGSTELTATKTSDADGAVVAVGDEVIYTVCVENGEDATVKAQNVVISDEIPVGLTFKGNVMSSSNGSRWKNVSTDNYLYKDGILTVNCGDIDAGDKEYVQFTVTVNDDAQGSYIKNLAVITDDNGDEENAPDKSNNGNGIAVEDGDTALKVVKTSDKSGEKVDVGDTVKYIVTISNDKSASVAARNAVFTDTMPEGLSFNEGSVKISYNGGEDWLSAGDKAFFDDGILTVNCGDIGIGKTVAVKFTANLTKDALNRFVLNTGVVTDDNGDSIPFQDDTNNGKGIETEDGDTDLSVEKTSDSEGKIVEIGDDITYTIKVSNSKLATVAAENVVITDNLPDGVSFQNNVRVSSDGEKWKNMNSDNYLLNGRSVTFEIGDVGIKEAVYVSFDVTVKKEAYNTRVLNTGVVTDDNGNSIPFQDETNNGTGIPVETGDTDLSVVKTSDKEGKLVEIGEQLTYTIEVSNSKLATVAAENVVITDNLPKGIVYRGNVSMSLNNGAEWVSTNEVNYSNGTLSANVGNIAPGNTVMFRFEASVDAGIYGAYLLNAGVLTDDNGDNVPFEDDTNGGMGVHVDNGVTDLSVVKTNDSNGDEVAVNDTVTYTIAVTNGKFAEQAVENVVITDTLPDELKFAGNVMFSSDGKTWAGIPAQYLTVDGNTLTIKNLGNVERNSTWYVRFDTTVTKAAAGQTIVNEGILTDDSGDSVSFTDKAAVSVAGNVKLSATKTSDANGKTVCVGDEIKYTIRVMNAPDATEKAKNVVVTDTLPENLKYSYGSCVVASDFETGLFSKRTDAIYNDGKLTVDVGTLCVGEAVDISFVAEVKDTAYGDTILNSGNVTDKKGNVIPFQDETNGGTGIPVKAGKTNLSVVKTSDVDGKMVKVGDYVTYTIHCENDYTAQIDATGVVLTDSLPVGLDLPCLYQVKHTDDDKYKTLSDITFDGRDIAMSVGDIEAGGTCDVQFICKVNDDAYASGYILNTGKLTCNEGITIPFQDETNGGKGINPEGGSTALSVEKEASKDSVDVGEAFTYTITVKNGLEATRSSTGVSVRDQIPEGLEVKGVQVTLPGHSRRDVSQLDCDYSGVDEANFFSLTIPELDKGEVAKVYVTVKATDALFGESIQNIVWVEDEQGSSATATDEGVTVNDGKAELTVEKSVINTTAKADGNRDTNQVGDSLTYTVKVTNSASAQTSAKNVYIKDKLNESLEFLGIAQVSYDGETFINAEVDYLGFDDKGSQTIGFSVADLELGKSVYIRFVCAIGGNAYGKTITNTAIASADNAEDASSKTTDSTMTAVAVDPATVDNNAQIEKFVSKGNGGNLADLAKNISAEVGDTITYTFKITNPSSSTGAWHNIKITDVLGSEKGVPTGNNLSFLTDIGNFKVMTADGESTGTNAITINGNNNIVTINPADVAPGETVYYSFSAKITDDASARTSIMGKVITNSATFTQDDDTEKPVINNPTIQVAAGKSDVTIKKNHTVRGGKEYVEFGDFIDYTIVIKNGKNATAPWEDDYSWITEQMPDGVNLYGNVYISEDGGKPVAAVFVVHENGNDWRINLNNELGHQLQPGSTVEVTFAGQVGTGYDATQPNCVVCSDPVIPTVPDEDPTPPGKAIINITKSHSIDMGKTEIGVGDTVHYTIVVSNDGHATGSSWDGIVEDKLPSGMELYDEEVLVNGKAYSSTSKTDIKVNVGKTIGTLEAGESCTITFTAVVTENKKGGYTNYAYADGKSANDKTIPCSDTTTTTPPKDTFQYRIDFNKDAPETAKVGEVIPYTINITNTGTECLYEGVVVTDILDNQYVEPRLMDGIWVDGNLKARGDGWSYTDGVLTVKLGTMDCKSNKEATNPTSHKIVFYVSPKFEGTLTNTVSAKFNVVSTDKENPAQYTQTEYATASTAVKGDAIKGGIHYQLTTGREEGTHWCPNAQISLEEACIMCYRALASTGHNVTSYKSTGYTKSYYAGLTRDGDYMVAENGYKAVKLTGNDTLDSKYAGNWYFGVGNAYSPGTECEYWEAQPGVLNDAGYSRFDQSRHIIKVVTISDACKNPQISGTATGHTPGVKNADASNTDVYGSVWLVGDNGTVKHICTTPGKAELNNLIKAVTGTSPNFSSRFVTRYEFASALLNGMGRIATTYDYSLCDDVLGYGSHSFTDVTSAQQKVVIEASNSHFENKSIDGNKEQWTESTYGTNQSTIELP